jgi:endoglucanase
LLLTENDPAKFRDGDLRLPESGNGLPDAFDEALWLPRFYQRARAEILRKNWGTGGVPGARVFGDLWGSDTQSGDIGRGSWSDNDRDWYLLGEDAIMSFKYAGIAANILFSGQ